METLEQFVSLSNIILVQKNWFGVFFTHPQWRPITSIINVRWCEYAVLTMASIASIMRCRAESVPMVMSVPQKSLSIEPTIPAMCNTPYFCRCSALIFPVDNSSSNRLAHSWRNKLAPVKEPSPPMTTFWIVSNENFCITIPSKNVWWMMQFSE